MENTLFYHVGRHSAGLAGYSRAERAVKTEKNKEKNRGERIRMKEEEEDLQGKKQGG